MEASRFTTRGTPKRRSQRTYTARAVRCTIDTTVRRGTCDASDYPLVGLHVPHPCQQKFDPSKLQLKICLSESEKHSFFKKIIFSLLPLLLPLLFWVHFRDGLIGRKQVYKRHWLATQWRIVALFVSHKTKIKFGHGIGFLCEVQRGLTWVIRQFWVKSTSIQQPHIYVPKLLLACRYSSTGGLVLQSWFELHIDLRRQTCKFW